MMQEMSAISARGTLHMISYTIASLNFPVLAKRRKMNILCATRSFTGVDLRRVREGIRKTSKQACV